MNLSERIALLHNLGLSIVENDELLRAAKRRAEAENPWFSQQNIERALTAIQTHFLDQTLIERWIAKYSLDNNKGQSIVGLVLAGNIPLVGFHDIICIFLSNNIAQIKCSSKDEVLMKWMVNKMIELDPRSKSYFQIVEQLNNFDAVIATGSNNAARYFFSYFEKYPHLIRKNRNAVAILDETVSKEELMALGDDIFAYFGLGCRNISKLYLKQGLDFKRIFDVWGDQYQSMINHNKYKNNFDYNYSIFLLNKDEFYTNNAIIFKPDEAIASRIGCVNFEYFEDEHQLISIIKDREEEIQCVVSNMDLADVTTIEPGTAQKPRLNNYADGVDTIQFLLSIN